MKLFGYPVEVYYEEDGTLAARVPDLPGCVAAGETPEELFAALEDAVEGWLEAARAHEIRIPAPSRLESHSGHFVVRMAPTLHGKLAQRARREGVSLNLLVVSMLAEAVGSARGEPAMATGPRLAAFLEGHVFATHAIRTYATRTYVTHHEEERSNELVLGEPISLASSRQVALQ